MGARRIAGLAGLLLAAGCSAPSATPATTAATLPPPATLAAATTTTAAPSTTEAGPVVIPATGSPPVQVDPRSTCMRRARFGDPADSPYLLPFPIGEQYHVPQSYCRVSGGHRDQLAYDFDMPIGTEVLASRAGTVMDLRDDSPDDGHGDGEHNFLMIRHDDGTVAFYAHLRQHGLLVGLGDEVAAGQLIAYSGNSGLTSGPHLHFGVYQTWPPREGYDVPVVFANAGGDLDLLGGLATDGWYEALPLDQTPAAGSGRPSSSYADLDLRGADLAGANLWGYDFSRSDLTGADLTGAALTGASLADAVLVGADLSFARLESADLQGADLRNASLAAAALTSADLRTAGFGGTSLRGADLTLADLRDADLEDGDLTNAYLATTDLRGTDLSDANLEGALLIGAVWDERTRWPEGYDPPPQP